MDAAGTRRRPSSAVTGSLALLGVLAVSLYFNVQLQEAADNLEKQSLRRPATPRPGPRSRRRPPTTDRIEARGRRSTRTRPGPDAEAKKQEAERGVYALQLFKAAALGERDPQRALKLLDDRDRCPEDSATSPGGTSAARSW